MGLGGVFSRRTELPASRWQVKRLAKRAALFRSMTRAALSRLLDNSTQAAYDVNHVIVQQGDRDETVYLVLSGRVRVTQSGTNNSEMFIAELGPGEVFGELAVLESLPRSATVLTLERTWCLKIPGAAFLAALSQSAP
jgi:CRP/FNR family cyclic AMP-dependent transcriptional regulator